MCVQYVHTNATDLKDFLDHIVNITNTNCLTPLRAMAGQCSYVAANLYARSSFGEDALVNVSLELEDVKPAAGTKRNSGVTKKTRFRTASTRRPR